MGGVATLLLAVDKKRRRRETVVRLLAGLIAAISGLTLFEHLSGQNLWIDTALFNQPWGQNAAAAPMRMGPPAASSFLILAAALNWATRRTSSRRFASALAILICSIVSLSLTGYWFGADELYGVARFTGIAWQTSVMLTAISIALMAALSECGITKALMSDDAGGQVLRRLIVPVIMLPLVLGWLRVYGQEIGLYDTAFGTALRSLAEVVLFFLLLWWTGSSISRHAAVAKQAEEAAREARSRLESTLVAGEIGTWEFDIVNNIVRADRNLDEMFGIAGPGTLARPLEVYLNALHSDDRASVEAALGRAIEAGEKIELEIRVMRPDGKVRWLAARGRVEHDEAGRAVRLPGVAVDITERMAARERERALSIEAATANAKFRAFFDQGPLFAGIMALDGTLLEANRLSLEACGYRREQVIGKLFWECPWWSGSEKLRETIKAATARAAAGEQYRAELPYFVANGSERMVDFEVLPIKDEKGRVLFLAPTGSDITERKLAEEDRNKFVALAENTTDFIGMCDLEGKAFYVNKSGLKLVGLDSLTEAQRTPVREFFFPEDVSRIVDEFFPKILRDGNGEIEVRFRHFKTGRALWMLYKVITLRGEDGTPVGFATVSRDITQRRELEDNLRQLASDLSEGSRRKDEFLAMLAHELRNPLAPIRNSLMLMKLSEGNGETVVQARSVIERQLIQMVRLVDDLLDVSRITRGKIELRCERVELESILQQAIETSRPSIESANQELAVMVPAEPLHLMGDAVRLVQVFSNLLNNSCKYSESGGRITLSAERQGDGAVITVRDTGIGIPPEMLPQVFDMFTQADRSLDRAEGGLGIGLALARRIVEMHDGSISATSEGTGQGSTFVVRLPLDIGWQGPLAEADEHETKLVTARRILVVDDNEDSAASLAMLLKLAGNETEVAHDGLAAIDAAEKFRPDAVLLDIGLPKLNGYEVAREIRQQPWGATMKLIALTGWGQDEDRRKSREAGFNGHLVKPADFGALTKMLDEGR
jgi:PAS domain S-box-containing protein